jgi:hypothetical protein
LTTTGPKGTESPFQTMFADEKFWLVYLFIPPLLTMRLFAEERSSGTLEMLMTAPLRDWQVVLSKYLACLAFYVVLWLPTLAYLPALLGARQPIVSPAFTLWSSLLLGGVLVLLVGLFLLLFRLGTLGLVVSILLILAGLGLAGVGGWQHYTVDPVHLVEIPSAGWRPLLAPGLTLWSILLLSGLAALLSGGLLLLPRLGTPARLVSVLLILAGLGLAGVGGWKHYTADPVSRLSAPLADYWATGIEHQATTPWMLAVRSVRLGEPVCLVEIPLTLDPAPVLATYLGMFLAGAMFLSLGLLISSLVRDQMVAAIITLALGLLFIGAGFWRPEQDGSGLYQVVYFFSVPLHFERAFTRGIIDTRPVVLYASITLFCLFLTVRSLESRRWQ